MFYLQDFYIKRNPNFKTLFIIIFISIISHSCCKENKNLMHGDSLVKRSSFKTKGIQNILSNDIKSLNNNKELKISNTEVNNNNFSYNDLNAHNLIPCCSYKFYFFTIICLFIFNQLFFNSKSINILIGDSPKSEDVHTGIIEILFNPNKIKTFDTKKTIVQHYIKNKQTMNKLWSKFFLNKSKEVDNFKKKQNTYVAKYKKNIWIMWYQGWNETLPLVVHKTYQSWKYYNKDWKLFKLDKYNLNNYLRPLPFKKEPSIQAMFDIIRIRLLNKYGGVWVDASLFCNDKLNKWLLPYWQKNNSFFAFSNPTPDKKIASWFIASKNTNSYIVKNMHESTINYWFNKINGSLVQKTRHKKEPYYWFHFLFNDNYNKDEKFKYLWNKTLPKINAPYSPKQEGPHYITKRLLEFPVQNDVKNHILSKKSPVYKLDWRKDVIFETSMFFLFDTISDQKKKKAKFTFIHIPKTGGTSIENSLYINGINVGRFANKKKVLFQRDKYKCDSLWHIPYKKFVNNSFCIIRNPYERIISEYKYRKISNTGNCNCEKFLLFTKNKLKTFEKKPSVNDCHYIEQNTFSEKADVVIFFENLKKRVGKFLNKFNVTIKLTKDNSQEKFCKKDQYLNVSCIDNELGRVINRIYFKDFKKFGYKMLNFSQEGDILRSY